MHPKFIFLLLTPLFFGCNDESVESADRSFAVKEKNDDPLNVEHPDQNPDEFKCENLVDDQNIRQGYWCIYGSDLTDSGYQMDAKIEEGPYVNGMKRGTWIYYAKNRVIHQEVEYMDDVPHGMTKTWDYDAKIQILETYENGIKTDSTALPFLKN